MIYKRRKFHYICGTVNKTLKSKTRKSEGFTFHNTAYHNVYGCEKIIHSEKTAEGRLPR
jgi:hypothetical protein